MPPIHQESYRIIFRHSRDGKRIPIDSHLGSLDEIYSRRVYFKSCKNNRVSIIFALVYNPSKDT